MADIKMTVDAAVVVPVNVAPIVDAATGATFQAVAYNAAGMDMRWNFVTPAGVVTCTAVTPTTGSNHDWIDNGDGMCAMEIPASGGTVNNDTEGFGWWTGKVTASLPFRGPIVQFSPANVIDSLVKGTDKLDVNAAELGGTSQTGRDIGASVLLSSGTGTGQVTLTSGRVNADVTHIATAAVSTSAAQLGVNVVNFGGNAGTFASGVPSVVLTTNGVNAVADQVWDEDITTHGAANSAGAAIQPVRSGTCQNGGDTTHVILDASASATADAYKYQIIVGWKTADRTNKFSDIITAYNGTTKSATVTGIPFSPDNTYTFAILPFGAIPGATAPTAAEVADAVWDEAASGHTTSGSFGQFTQSQVSHTGTAQAGSSSSITLASGANSTQNNIYRYQTIEIVGGTGAGQASYCTGYTASSRVATVDPAWSVTPDATSVYVVKKLGLDAATPGLVADAVWDEARSGHALAGSFGEYVLSDVQRISGDATAADNCESYFDGTGYAGGAVKLQVQLADTTHGGSSSTITAKRVVVANTTNDETAVDISASGTGNAHALRVNASGGGKGVAIGAASVGLSIDSSTADAVQIQGGTNSDGLQVSGNGTGVDIRGNITGNLSGSIESVASGGITAASIATGAIDADSLAADAGTEIGTAVWASADRQLTALDEDVTSIDLNNTAVGSVTSGVTVATNNDKTGYTLSNAGIDSLYTRQLVESYAADGAVPTVAQALLIIQQMLGDFAITGTTLTVRKVNGSTTAATFTLDDGSTPTAITRSG